MINLRTSKMPTWCPGCYNFQILAGVQRFIEGELNNGKKKNNFAIVTGIGCHAKIFDSLSMYGINTLHGRVAPTCLGLKLAKPELTVLAFSGDGDAYSEGMEHLVHAARYNSDFKYIVHNNQVFALTVGEPTPVSEKGFIDKTNPGGNKVKPINALRVVLASGTGFVARVFAETNEVEKIIGEAVKHKGFTFIEIIQPCLVFHDDKGYKERLYNLQAEGHDKTNFIEALKKADEWDYDSKESRIPTGIFYQKERETFESVKLRSKHGKGRS